MEEDGLTDPANVDTDGDGLSDYTEDDLSINVRVQDTDGDGLRDDYEVANAESADRACHDRTWRTVV